MNVEGIASWLGIAWKIFAVTSAILGLVHFILNQEIENKERELNRTSGIIKGKEEFKGMTDYQKFNSNSTNFTRNTFYVKTGSNLVALTKSSLKKGISLSKIFPLITGLPESLILRYENGQVLISGSILSYDGRIVAEIKDNTWTVNPHNFFQRNYDGNALEIIDDYNVPVVQIMFENNFVISINGIFIKNNQLLVFDKNGTHIVNVTNPQEYREIGKGIERIFKYPAETNLGVRIKSSE